MISPDTIKSTTELLQDIKNYKEFNAYLINLATKYFLKL